ncbi:MAG TPA: hypothetical protein VF692_03920 [Pyrinomonadaceae bacterium]
METSICRGVTRSLPTSSVKSSAFLISKSAIVTASTSGELRARS